MQYIFITIIIIIYFLGTAGGDMYAACDEDATNYYFTEIGRNKKALVDENGFGMVVCLKISDRSNANAIIIIIIITTRIAYYYFFFDYHTTSTRVGIHYSQSFVSRLHSCSCI